MPRLAAIAVLAALAAPTLGVWTTTARAEDRYGPQPAYLAATYTGPTRATATSLLTWPGKQAEAAASPPMDAAPDPAPVAEAAPPPPPRRQPLPVSIYAPQPPPARKFASLGPVSAGAIGLREAPESAPAPATVSYPPAATARPIAPTRPAPAATTAVKSKSSQPAPSTATVTATAASVSAAPATHAALPPRLYSLHREFGLTPDPIPLPKQFFADSAATDLAAPPPPLDPRPVPGTQAATSPANTASNRARESALATADTQADGPVGGGAAF
jgi:hypothetical protein